MKKIFKLAAIFAASITMLLTSCNNQSTDVTVSGGFKKTITDLTITAACDSNLLNFEEATINLDADSEVKASLAARTITPAALDGTTNVKFYLGGINKVTAEKVYATNVVFSANGGSTTSGKITVDLEPSNYMFTLVALLTSDPTAITSTTEVSSLLSTAVLVGYANADLRYPEEAQNVNFYLSPDGLTGSGKIDFDFYLKDWSTSSKDAKIGGDGANKDSAVITDAVIKLTKPDGTDVSGTTVTGQNFTGKEAQTDVVPYDGTVESALDSLPAGTYSVLVTFTKDGRKYTWSDDVKVLPGQTTTGKFGIPDLLVGAPEAPTAFVQSYGEPLADDSDNYYLYFTWTDNSKTEQNFEIDLYDITTATTLVATTLNAAGVWGDSGPTNTTTYSSNFYGYKSDTKPSWYAGSLQKNNKFAAFYVPLGKRYLARIRAVSEAGNSEYCYAKNATADGGTGATYTITTDMVTAENVSLSNSINISGKMFNGGGDVINLYRISYKTNGGEFTGSPKTVYYFDQKAAGIAVMCPDGATTNAQPYAADAVITLKLGSIKWSNWKIAHTSGVTYPSQFAVCTQGAAADPATLYYEQTTIPADINGDTTYYKVCSTQPTTLSTSHYTNTGVPNNYKGYANLTLYANYTSNTFAVTIQNPDDYTFKTNYTTTVSGTGTGTAPALTINGDANSVSIERSGDNSGPYTITSLKWTLTPVTTPKATYGKITAELFQLGTASGDISKGTFTASSNMIEMGVTTLKSGKYKVVFKGYVGSSTTPYTQTIYMTLTD